MVFDYEALGRVVKRLRKEKHLSQEVLSGFSCIARSHLSAIESGSNALTLDTIYKVSQALDMPLSELIRLAEQESQKSQS